MKRLSMLAAALCASAPVAAPLAAQQAPDSSRVHVVRPGDTLWDLSRLYLNNPYLWPQIFQLNQGEVQNPNLIFPRERLRIPGAGGPVAVAGVRPVEPRAPGASPGHTVFYGSLGSQMSGGRVGDAQAESVPVVAPGDFYGAGMLVQPAEVRAVGTLLEPLAPSAVETNIPPQIGPYDKVYMTLAAPGAVRVGEWLHLLRSDQRVRPHGEVFVPTGTALVLAVDGPTATLEVRELFDAVEVGNLAVPMPKFEPVRGVTPQPAAGATGRIVAFQVPQPVHSVRDVAFLDIGRSAGLVEGDELLAVLPPTGTGVNYRPGVVVARLQVVRVTERTAAARVVEMEYPALEPGLAVRLTAKMP